MSYAQSTPSPIEVYIEDYGCEYIPEGIGGRDVHVLRATNGTMVRIAGREWGWDLEVTALTWEGRLPHPDQRDVTWMTKVRRSGSTHRQMVNWWRDELAGLHRQGAEA